MNLRATINGTQYDILQGATFAEEYNETLDSGSIIINNVSKIKGLMPYDDVFIYSFTDSNYKFIGYPFDETNPQPKFYKHLLVDQFTEEVLRLGDSEEEGRYKYKIELMSETKKLETIQLPNCTITQPIEGRKITVWNKASDIVDLYSPQYKKQVYLDGLPTNKWEYVNKYSLSETLRDVFSDCLAPEKSFNAPTLRAFLSALFIVKDMIPYVKDDVIYAMDISKRNGEFDKNPQNVNVVTGSMTSDNYCDNLRRNYSEAVSQNGICRSVECVNFRNSDNALMTIENMRIELGYPIYRINKMYMCYYKKIKVTHVKESSPNTSQTVYILCQQDISKLVKLNTERNALSQDWSDLHKNNIPTSVDEMAKYRFCTIGYDMGSKYIEGWGKFYTYPGFYNDNRYTYVQNLLTRMEYFFPYGILSNADVKAQFKEEDDIDVKLSQTYDSSSVFTAWESAQSIKQVSGDKITDAPDNGVVYKVFDSLFNLYSNASLKLKSLFFVVDYQGFYDGTVVHSKDNKKDDIVINDNSSDSLTILEQDSVLQKGKINRFGNKALQINARYKSFFNDKGSENLQQLGSVYNSNYEKDVIIYHREYSIYDNYVSCIYYGIQNYILKNWFTSVFARYRTWRLMSYNESIKRAENEKEYFYWSDKEQYYENGNIVESDIIASQQFFSFLKSYTTENIIGIYDYQDNSSINTGYIISGNNKFYSDMQAFCGDKSICFNIKMNDNYTQGPFISIIEPFAKVNSTDASVPGAPINNNGQVIDISSKTWNELLWGSNSTDYAGSKQQWTVLADDNGYAPRLGFYVGHQDNEDLFYFNNFNKLNSEGLDVAGNKIRQAYTSILANPKMIVNINNPIGIEKKYNKDNKEYLDLTLQFENMSLSDNIILSPWIFKLSDLLGQKARFMKDIEKPQSLGFKSGVKVYAVQFEGYKREYKRDVATDKEEWQDVHSTPVLVLQIGRDDIRRLNSVEDVDGLKELSYASNIEIDFAQVGTDRNFPTKFLTLQAEMYYRNFTNCIFLNKFKCKKIQFRFENDSDITPTMAFLRGELSFFIIKKGALTRTDEQVQYDHTLYEEKIINDFAFYLPIMGENKSFSGTLMPNGMQEYAQCGLRDDEEWLYFASLADNEPNEALDRGTFDKIFGKVRIHKNDWFPSLISPVGICGGTDMSALPEGFQNNPYVGAFSHLKNFRYKDGEKEVSYPIPLKLSSGTSFSVDLSLEIGCYLGAPIRSANTINQYSSYGSGYGLEWNKKSFMDLQKQEITILGEKSIVDIITYHKNMFLVPSLGYIDKDIVPKTYTYKEFIDEYGLVVSDYISLVHEDSKGVYIEIKPVEMKVLYTKGRRVDNFQTLMPDIEGINWTQDRDGVLRGFLDGNMIENINHISDNGIVTLPTGTFFANEHFTCQSTTTMVVPKGSSAKNIRIPVRYYGGVGAATFISSMCKSFSIFYFDDGNAYKKDFGPTGAIIKASYEPQDCLYHFVFGVNLPDMDKNSEPFKVYISGIKRKDMRVFDKYHQVIGKSLNYAEHPEQYALGENFSDYDNDSLPNVKDFSTLTWKYIKNISDTGLASKYWKVGDTKTFTSKSGNVYTIRIVDMKDGRYSFVKGGSNHMVLEFVECVKLDGQTTFEEGLDADNNYIGSTLQTAVLKNIFDDLPDDLQAVIAEVNIDVYNNTSPFKFENPISTAGKLFLPSVSELTLSYGSNNFINTVMEYYIGDTAEARRIKSEKYWTRDCYYSNVPAMSFSTLYYVDTDGRISHRFDSGVERKAGVAPFFAI